MEKNDRLFDELRQRIESRKNAAPAGNRRSRKHFFFLLNIFLLGVLIYLYTGKEKEQPQPVMAVFQAGDVRVRLNIQDEKISGYRCLVSLMSTSESVRVLPVKNGRLMVLDFTLGKESIHRQEITLPEPVIRLAPGETRVFSRYIDEESINPAAKKYLENTKENLPQFLGIEKRRVKIGVIATLLVEGGGSRSLVLDYQPR